jgi:hypothetical protein
MRRRLTVLTRSALSFTLPLAFLAAAGPATELPTLMRRVHPRVAAVLVEGAPWWLGGWVMMALGWWLLGVALVRGWARRQGQPWTAARLHATRLAVAAGAAGFTLAVVWIAAGLGAPAGPTITAEIAGAPPGPSFELRASGLPRPARSSRLGRSFDRLFRLPRGLDAETFTGAEAKGTTAEFRPRRARSFEGWTQTWDTISAELRRPDGRVTSVFVSLGPAASGDTEIVVDKDVVLPCGDEDAGCHFTSALYPRGARRVHVRFDLRELW